MSELTRRGMLATAGVAGRVLTAAATAIAHTADPMPQPSRMLEH